MSRIGKLPIKIIDGVNVQIDGNEIVVKGPKGSLTSKVHSEMKVLIENGEILVQRPSNDEKHRSLHGLTRSLINNMVIGVTEGFKKALEVNGVGYRVQKQGKKQ